MFTFEYLSPSSIRNLPSYDFIDNFLRSTGRTQIGWHYIIDLAWMHNILNTLPKGSNILDAGGGFGPVQFLLAELGYNVTNVDLFFNEPSRALLNRYALELQSDTEYKKTEYYSHLQNLELKNKKSLISSSADILRDILYLYRHYKWSKRNTDNISRGKIIWKAANLCDLSDFDDNTFDAVVSLSALEHIPVGQIEIALNEIRRIVKKDAKWAVTTSASCYEEKDYHKPSQCYCFSEEDLAKYFLCETGIGSREDTLQEYQNDNLLKDNIAKFYITSGDNGMPWGTWDPKYLPIGIKATQ